MVKDHFGNEYSSISEMCKKYGVDKNIFLIKMEGREETPENLRIALTNSSIRSANKNEYKALFGPMSDRMFKIRSKMQSPVYKGRFMTQGEFGEYLADISGFGKPFTVVMVSAVENGRRCFDLDVYIALAKKLNVSMDYLFGRIEDNTPYNQPTEFKTYYELVKDIVGNASEFRHMVDVGDVRERGVEARLRLANRFEVPLDYLCGMTNETVMHQDAEKKKKPAKKKS